MTRVAAPTRLNATVQSATTARVGISAFVLVGVLSLVAATGAAVGATQQGEAKVFNCKELVSKPRNLNLTCDGPPTFVIDGEKYPGSGGKLTKIKWTSWGTDLAKGTGTLALSTKDETTAQVSVYKRMKVSITLNKPRNQQGERVFTEAITTQGPDSEVNTWPIKKWRGQ